MPTAFKAVRRVMPRPPRHWVGNGFHVYPVFAQLAFTAELSPWLMFDYAAPKEFGPTSSRRGVGQHPHRGFETITIAFQGEVEHADSVGNRDVIGPGDVQWMTAARGIIHEEYHSDAFSKRGGTFEMAQLWLNLPASKKMDEPAYQPILASAIPAVALRPADAGSSCPSGGAGLVRIIAGELQGTRGPATTRSPAELFDVELPSVGTPVEIDVPDGHNMIVFVREGELRIGPDGDESTVGAQGVALMHTAGSKLRMVAGAPDTKLLLLGGQPLDEPIAAQGPFVMNTRKELMQANVDFQEGRLGR